MTSLTYERTTRGTTAGDAVGLLNEDDEEARLGRVSGDRKEVRRTDTTARTMPEDEAPDRTVGLVHVGAGRSVSRLDLESACHGTGPGI